MLYGFLTRLAVVFLGLLWVKRLCDVGGWWVMHGMCMHALAGPGMELGHCMHTGHEARGGWRKEERRLGHCIYPTHRPWTLGMAQPLRMSSLQLSKGLQTSAIYNNKAKVKARTCVELWG